MDLAFQWSFRSNLKAEIGIEEDWSQAVESILRTTRMDGCDASVELPNCGRQAAKPDQILEMNAFELAPVINDAELYWPRFVRVNLK